MSSQNPIAIPPELREVRSSALEGYVRDRLVQFATAFSEHCMPSVTPEVLQKAIHETIAKLPPPDSGHLPVDRRELQLVFRHDCQALGCSDAQCSLCQHNPHRRCLVNFDRKYLVGDVLKAKCSANIRCEVVDRSTGVLFEDDIPDLKLEMCILDGNLYDQRCLDGGSDTEEDLRACTLLENNKKTPLLVGLGVVNDDKNAVVMSLLRGKAQLPDLHVTDSSEALLSGRKPPFRLLVATRRTRTAGKADIPLVDDHVSKLEHMGKETVKKLQNIPEAAQQLGIELGPLPVDMVEKVGEFKTLAAFAESDGHLRQKLQQVLKLSKEKWDEARVHAMKAVVPDNRMRVWYASPTQRQIGLLFLCKQGAPQLDRVVGMVQSVVGEKSQAKLLVTMLAQLNPDQREMLRNLSPNAVQQWWHTGHTGWSIFPYDSNTYSQTGTLGPYVTLTDPPAGNTGASIPAGGGNATSTPSTGASTPPAWNSTAPAAAAPAAAAAASAEAHLKKLGHPAAAAGGMPEGRPGARPAMALPHMGGAVVPPSAGSRGSSAVGSGSAPLGTPFDAGDSSHPFAGLPSGSGLSLDMDMGAPVGGGGTKRRADNSLRLGSIFSGQLPSMSLPGPHALLDPLQSAGEGPESRGAAAMRPPQGAGGEGLGPSMASTAAALNDLPLTMMNSHDIESEMGLAMGTGAPMMSGRGVPGGGAGERPGHAMGSMVGQYNMPAPHKMEGLFPVAAGDGMAISRGPSTGLDTMMSMERSLPEVDGDATRMMDQAVKNVSGSTYVQHETGALV